MYIPTVVYIPCLPKFLREKGKNFAWRDVEPLGSRAREDGKLQTFQYNARASGGREGKGNSGEGGG